MPSARRARMTVDVVVALVAFLFPLAYSPGPGNAFFAALGATRGMRAAVPALAGYHVATLIVTAFIGVGMGATVLRHPAVADTLAAAGGAYVLWLAWTFLRSARAATPSRDEPAVACRVGFWSGAIVLLLNPKAYYIVAAMFTQFARPPFNDDATTVLTITVVFTLNNLVAFVVWAAAGRGLTALFRSERASRRIDYLFAAVLLVVAAWMAAPLAA